MKYLIILLSLVFITCQNTGKKNTNSKKETKENSKSVPAVGQGKKIQDSNNLYSITAPKGWEIKEKVKRYNLKLFPPRKEGIVYDASIDITRQKGKVSYDTTKDIMIEKAFDLPEYCKSYFDSFEESFTNYTETKRGKAKINGLNVQYCQFEAFHEESDRMLRFSVYVYAVDKVAYILSASAESGDYLNYFNDFQTVMRSFRAK